MSHFCLKQGWETGLGFEGLGGTPLPRLPLSAPPPPAINSSTLLIKLRNDGTIVSCLDQGKV